MTSASAEIVDLATTPLDTRGNKVRTASMEPSEVQQVQAQTPIPDPITQAPGQTPSPLQPPGQLNTNPNANINDINMPQAPAPPTAPQNFNTATPGLGATAGAFSAAPTIFGDFQGGGLAQISGRDVRSFSLYAPGFYVSGSPGEEVATIAYRVGPMIVPDDIFSTGNGIDAAGNDNQFDTFAILEPIPPSDAPTSPGPGFTFDGGTAVYTGASGPGAPTTAQPGLITDGEQWFISYSYSQQLGIGDGHGGQPVPSPGVSVRRVKIAENFSPEVRDRVFLNYSFFNDAFGGLGDISRYVPGFEHVLVDDLISVEARFPVAGTFGSTQTLGGLQDRAFEFGNPTIIGKGVLLRTDKFIWSGGMGIGLPLADDTVVRSGGRDVIRIKNESVFLQPFTGLLVRKNRDTAFQGYLQLDVAANADPIFANLTGGTSLPKVGEFKDSTLLHIDVAASHSLYRNRCSKRVREVILNGEIHYSGTLQGSDFVQGNNFTYTNLKRNFNVVNATAGIHLVMANNMVISPAMSVPLTDGLDEQFDYEAIVQMGYYR